LAETPHKSQRNGVGYGGDVYMDGTASGFGTVTIPSDTIGVTVGADCTSVWKAIPKRPVEST